MQLEQHLVVGNGYARNIWYLPCPADIQHRLCVFLDGEHYQRDMQAVPALAELLEGPTSLPLSLLFVSHVAPGEGAAEYEARRTADYTCNEGYARFTAEEIVQWATRRNPGIRPSGHVICGLSLSGLQSAFTTIRHPAVFSSCLSQSGSFWWLHGRSLDLGPTKAKFWFSVGDQETATQVAHSPQLYQMMSQIAGVEMAAENCRRSGGTVHFCKYPGGHDMAAWKAELPTALRWLSAASETGKP